MSDTRVAHGCTAGAETVSLGTLGKEQSEVSEVWRLFPDYHTDLRLWSCRSRSQRVLWCLGGFIESGARKIRSSSRRLDMISTTPGGTHGSFEVTCRPRRLTTAAKATAVCLCSIVFDSSLDIGRRTALGKSLSYLLSSRPREWYTWRILPTHLFETVLNSGRSSCRSKDFA